MATLPGVGQTLAAKAYAASASLHPHRFEAFMTPSRSLFRRSAPRFALVAPLALVAVCGAHAQEFRGTISGSVTDASGAAIPGAAVVVREIHTGTTNRTKSDSAGQYVVPFLLPGDYQITVTQPGFQTEIRNNVTLEAQAHPIVAKREQPHLRELRLHHVRHLQQHTAPDPAWRPDRVLSSNGQQSRKGKAHSHRSGPSSSTRELACHPKHQP